MVYMFGEIRQHRTFVLFGHSSLQDETVAKSPSGKLNPGQWVTVKYYRFRCSGLLIGCVGLRDCGKVVSPVALVCAVPGWVGVGVGVGVVRLCVYLEGRINKTNGRGDSCSKRSKDSAGRACL